MKQGLGITVLVGVLTTLLAGCAGGEDEVQTEVGVTATEIVLGSHVDLTGPVAIWGVGVMNGARMRFDAANAAGGVHGRQIRLIIEDTQYQVPKAISAANKLINRDKIFAMFMAVGTPMNNAVMVQQFKAGVPNLFPGSGARSMGEPFNRLVFTSLGSYYEEVRAALKYFMEVEGKSTPCVIYQDTDYGIETLEGARDQAAAMGIEIAETSAHKPTATEFTAAILRLKNAGCDLVLMGTVHKDTVLVLEAARKTAWEGVAWVGNEATYGQVIAEQESGSGEGYYAFVPLPQIYEDDDLTPEVRKWFQQAKTRYGKAPGIHEMLGYRSADVLVEALKIAGPDLTRDKLITAIESITDYTDLFGYKLSYGPDDHKGVDESVLSQVQNGRWVKLGESIRY